MKGITRIVRERIVKSLMRMSRARAEKSQAVACAGGAKGIEAERLVGVVEGEG